MRAILLSRVSTDKQSLDGQTEQLRERAERDGYETILIETKESAVKLSEEERQGLNDMKRHIETSQVDAVFIWELSRLSRRPQVLYSIREYLQKHRVQLVCLHPEFKMFKEDFTIDVNANIVFGLYVSLCENEMELKKERFARAKKRNAELGKFNGAAKVKFGYKLNDKKEYVVDPEEARVVRQIYSMYCDKMMSLRDIVKELSDQGRRMAMTTVRYILREVGYCGKTTQHEGNLPRTFPAIVSVDMSDRALQRIEDNKKNSRRTPRIAFAKKLMKCCECGHAMSVSHSYRTTVYRCSLQSMSKLVVKPCHSGLSIETDLLDDKLWEIAKKVYRYRMKQHSEREKKEMMDESAVIIAKLKKCESELSKTEERKKRLSSVYVLGDISDEEYAKLRLGIEEKRADQQAMKEKLEARFAWLQDTILGIVTEDDEDIVESIESLEEKDKIVHKCIESILLERLGERDKLVTITTVDGLVTYWRKPYQRRILERVLIEKEDGLVRAIPIIEE